MVARVAKASGEFRRRFWTNKASAISHQTNAAVDQAIKNLHRVDAIILTLKPAATDIPMMIFLMLTGSCMRFLYQFDPAKYSWILQTHGHGQNNHIHRRRPGFGRENEPRDRTRPSRWSVDRCEPDARATGERACLENYPPQPRIANRLAFSCVRFTATDVRAVAVGQLTSASRHYSSDFIQGPHIDPAGIIGAMGTVQGDRRSVPIHQRPSSAISYPPLHCPGNASTWFPVHLMVGCVVSMRVSLE